MAATKKKPKSKAVKSKKSKKKAIHYVPVAAAMLLAAVLCGIFVYIQPEALLSSWITDFLFGLFSSGAYVLPVVLFALGIYVIQVESYAKLRIKSVFSLAEVILLCALIHIFGGRLSIPPGELYLYGIAEVGGGFVGGLLALGLSKLVGSIAAAVIIIFAMLVIFGLIAKVSLLSVAGSFLSGLFSVREEFEEIRYKDTSENGKKTRRLIEEHIPGGRKKLSGADLNFEIEPAQEQKPKKTAKKRTSAERVGSEEGKSSEITEQELQNRIKQIIYNEEELKAAEQSPEAAEHGTAEAAEPPQNEGNTEAESDGTAKKEQPQRAAATTAAERRRVSSEIEKAMEHTKPEYKYPPIDLLKKPAAQSADKRKEMYETANKLMEILKNFGVEAKLLQVTQGPAVTRYEIQPETGVKLSKITGLAEDIALNLAVPTVLVAPVPNKAAVGIEVPNNGVSTVSARELLESKEFKNAKSKLAVALGKDIGGNVVVGDIAKMPHVLIAGSTGSGKSVCINTIVTSILYKASPDEVKLIMVDPKVVELGVYNGIPHLLIPVVTDPKKAAGSLNWAVGEMMRRYGLFAGTGSRNLSGYNELMKKNGEEQLPQIVIIIDELADLMMVAAKEVEDYVCRLAQLARAAGIHLIIATQRPSVDVITGLIKANVPSRIAFAVSSQVDSRTILDKGGAEKLLGKGDMLYHPIGMSSALRVQGAFVSDEEIEEIVKFVKTNSEDNHYSEDLEEHIERCFNSDANSAANEDEDGDELLPEAIQLASELGQISTAMIQRRLKVGYARAGRIIDQMEMRGIISGANGSKPREVYMNRIQGIDDE